MQKISKPLAVFSYVFAAVLIIIYFSAEIIPRLYLSTGGRLFLLCGCCVFLWVGGFLLSKNIGSNVPMKINLRIYLGLFLMLFITLTLFDPLWGRNGGFVLWNRELFDAYIKNSLNLVPFRTIGEYFGKGDFRQFIINIAGNIVCLMPLGILLPLNFEKQRKTGAFLLTCGIIVLVIELLQFLTLTGSCDIDDLILNVAGAYAVFLIAKNQKIESFLKYIFLLEGEKI